MPKQTTSKETNLGETDLKAEVTSSICWLAEYLAVAALRAGTATARLADTTEAISLAKAELDRLASLLNHAGLLDTSQWRAWQKAEATTLAKAVTPPLAASQKVATK